MKSEEVLKKRLRVVNRRIEDLKPLVLEDKKAYQELWGYINRRAELEWVLEPEIDPSKLN